jgi:regulatory protein
VRRQRRDEPPDRDVPDTGRGQREPGRDVLDTGRGEQDPADAAARVDQAIAAAYRYLNRRERTQAEMRAHLERAGFGPADVQQAIRALVEDGQLDDARFARLFLQDKRELEGWGSDRIRQVLVARGVDPDLIETVLAEPGAGEEMERALELLRRRFPTPAWDRGDRERALGVLLRKGYDADLALEAITAHARAGDR